MTGRMLANRIGQETAQASMVLACEQPMTGYHETNFSMAYSSHLSWQSPDSPVPTEVYPSLAFDNLFESRGLLRNTSILDHVRDRAANLSQRVSATDKALALFTRNAATGLLTPAGTSTSTSAAFNAITAENYQAISGGPAGVLSWGASVATGPTGVARRAW